MEELKEVERAYCDFIERRHLTSLDNIPLMDVSQIYAKYNHPKLLEDISKLKRSSEEVNYIMKTSKSNWNEILSWIYTDSLRVKLEKLERDCDCMLLKLTSEHKRRARNEYEAMGNVSQSLLHFLNYNLVSISIAVFFAANAIKQLWKIDDRYFDRFKHNMESKKFLQLLPTTSKVQSFKGLFVLPL